MLLDATDGFYPNNTIPLRCVNDKGIVIKKGEESWVDLSNIKGNSTLIENMELNFSKGLDSLYGRFLISATDYEAIDLKKNNMNDYSLLEGFIEKKGLKIIDSVTTTNYSDPEKPYKISFSALAPYEIIGNKIYVSPFLHEPVSENLFSKPGRQYPIDLIYSYTKAYSTVIKVPENYKITYMPKNLEVDNKF